MKEIKYLIELKWPDKVAMLLALMMPILPKILPILIVLLFLTLFIDIKKLRFHSEFKTMTWLFALTYLFYVFGMLGSNHISDGLFILQVKLSFLVLPLFFLFHGPFHIQTLRRIFFAFVIGTFIHSLFCLNQGLNCYLETGWTECFFSSYFTYGFHTTYISIYYCLSILFIIYYLINYLTRLNWVFSSLLFFLLFYFIGFVLLFASKGGFLALLTVILVASLYFIYKKGNATAAILVFLGLLVTSLVSYFTTDIIRSRVNNAIQSYQLSNEELFEKYNTSTESTVVRLMIWHVCKEIISEHPMGVGSGDVKYVLNEKYKDYNMTGALAQSLNCHNQFYETTLAIGFQGLIILCVFILYLIYQAINRRNFLLLWVVVITVLNLFFESIFETQAGVLFFVFFTLLLLTSVPDVVAISENEQS